MPSHWVWLCCPTTLWAGPSSRCELDQHQARSFSCPFLLWIFVFPYTFLPGTWLPPCKVLLFKSNLTIVFKKIITLHQKCRMLLISREAHPAFPPHHVSISPWLCLRASQSSCGSSWALHAVALLTPACAGEGCAAAAAQGRAAYVGDVSGPQPQSCLEEQLCPPKSPTRPAMAPAAQVKEVCS